MIQRFFVETHTYTNVEVVLERKFRARIRELQTRPKVDFLVVFAHFATQ